MNWCELPANKYSLRLPERRATFCQYEADVHYLDLISHPCEGEWSTIAPVRILSVDIECCGRKGLFPDAKHDAVIQIASHVTVQGQGTLLKNIMTLDTCAPIVGAEVMSFTNERDLLMRWRDLLIKADADIIIGYNIMNFDLPYLIDRAETLKIPDFLYWGRVKTNKIRMRDTQFSSKAHGTRNYKEITIEGRVQLDMLMLIQRDYKLSSYSLNAVSAHFLGEQKEDVHHSCIADLQAGNEETRRRLAVYCLKDAYLPQRLFDKLCYMFNYSEMARVTGVPLSYLLTRGQSVKVYSQILRKCTDKGLVVPNIQHRGGSDGVSYEGATVLDAKSGYYEDPVATLDFASLYPSIMMAHNLCYSTLVRREDLSKLDPATVRVCGGGEPVMTMVRMMV
jgi:DNA polymerase delta subunit 1